MQCGRLSVTGPWTASGAVDLADCAEMIRDVGRTCHGPGPSVRINVEQLSEPVLPFLCRLAQLAAQSGPLRVGNRTEAPAGRPVRIAEGVFAAAPTVQQPKSVTQVIDMSSDGSAAARRRARCLLRRHAVERSQEAGVTRIEEPAGLRVGPVDDLVQDGGDGTVSRPGIHVETPRE